MSQELRIGDLPASLKDDLSRQAKDYAVPLILDAEFIGSGTLVRFRQCYGILTAAHVVKNDQWSVDCSAGSAQRLLVAITEQAHTLSIETRYLQIERTAEESKEYGPDLAFIKIPTSSFLSTIAARKSFLDISVDRDRRFENAADASGIVVVAGFADVYRREIVPEAGFETVQRLQGHGLLTGQERYKRQREYDYFEVGASYGNGDDPPLTFKGVSGGGAWRAHLSWDQDTGVYEHRMYLAGVVFYETALENNWRYLRAHGPESLYRIFFPRIINRFG